MNKINKLVNYYLANPLATAKEAAAACGTTRSYAHFILAKRQTPASVFKEHLQMELPLSGGVKHDQGKAPWHLLPPDAMEEVLKVLSYGANKYSERNWEKGMDWSRAFSAMMRHMWAWWAGEDHDGETGLSHLAHAACCVLFLLAYSKRFDGYDDRPHDTSDAY
jgi:hypothetical protein